MKKQAAIIFLVIAVCFGIYLPNISNEFCNWDFAPYQPVLYATNIITMAQRLLVDFKGEIVSGYYAPLCSISLMLDKYLVGSTTAQPRVTKLINLALHILNGILVFYVIRAVGGSAVVANIALFVFLMHPVQVHSVLWFTQRKTVLGGMFCLASYLAYLNSRKAGSSSQYGAAILLFGLALLSKPAYATFPLALLATEFLIPIASERRLSEGFSANNESAGIVAQTRSMDTSGPTNSTSLDLIGIRNAVIRTGPFFLVSLAFSVVTVQTEPARGIELPLIERPFIAAAALWFYLGKLLLPIDLSPIYPRWDLNPAQFFWWIPLVALVAALLFLAYFRKRLGNNVLWGLANFVVPVIPALGFFTFGYLRESFVADHFLYLSMLGFAYLIALILIQATTLVRSACKYAVIIGSAAYLVFFAVQTFEQGKVWADSVSVWSHTLKHNPMSTTAHNNLGASLLVLGRLDEAERHLRKALELDPGIALAYNNLGMIESQKGNVEEGIRLYRKALDIAPNLVRAHNNLGRALDKTGNLPLAIEHYQKAAALAPYELEIRYNFADALTKADRIGEAILQYEKSMELRPDAAKAHNTLGVLYLMQGNKGKGIAHLRKALEIDPHFLDAKMNLEHALTE